MRILILLILAALFTSPQSTLAQVTPQSEGVYRSAVNDYKQGKYAAAMQKLAPITKSTVKASYTPYAQYYYALSAYQQKRYRESRQMLVQLQSSYPGWNRINDVYYLLGAIGLESGQINEGLESLLKIKDSSFAKDVQGLKQHHLATVGDLPTLVSLQKQYPTDRDLALILIQFIEKAPSASQIDKSYAASLQKQFKFSNKEKVAAAAAETPKRSAPRSEGQWTKGYLDVAVLLPFRLDEFSSTRRRSNQFAYDYYLGLTMAKEQLATEGIQVNLWAYDVNNEAGPMENIVSNKNFQQSDIVIGPLYANTFDVTADYVSQSGTLMVNPLSTDATLLKSASNIYLGHPSINYQTQQAAQYMKTQSPGLSAIIYYGNTSKDSAMAASYSNEWKSNGGRVTAMVRIQPDREWLENNIPSFETAKPAHIALFSSDGSSGPNLIEVLNNRKLTVTPVVATSTSFNPQQSRISRYGSRLALIDPDYVDREKESIRQFQRNYWNKTSTFPSVYSYLGYDQLTFFARMLNQHKDKLASGIQAKRHGDSEYLLAGFDYTKSNENQITPILKYNGSKWVPVDR
ncbi:ABC transporter substrate-binding protein [Dyadobacter sp. CY343]|uniref:ABC transporter substrate-binding protein n=1 Tax=Dyadobacter sp. CY343 TaxID=2907299 RepID=UPI001F227994|nr:ABC transporter substrate-binding protein [Dyadobacter sp. CY343]MCE7060468.1 ABC transporter substrate-binding protein [Dyadobacter sp. CY343]